MQAGRAVGLHPGSVTLGLLTGPHSSQVTSWPLILLFSALARASSGAITALLRARSLIYRAYLHMGGYKLSAVTWHGMVGGPTCVDRKRHYE